jgi:tetratricopeptide (TPR) repeat protein
MIMNASYRTGLALALAVALVAIGAVAFFVSKYAFIPWSAPEQFQLQELSDSQIFARSQYQSAGQLHSNLFARNTAYHEGQSLRLEGKYAEAAERYRTALSQLSDPGERGVVQFWLAYSDAAAGDYAGAISEYKKIASASSTLSRLVRASAIQAMGHMYYRYGDPAITREIFKNGPYKTMYAQRSVPLSYRRLFDYAARLYPLALSELYSANWYADQLLAGTTSPVFVQRIRKQLSLAQQDIETLRGDNSQRYNYLNDLENRAVLLGKMKRLGDTSFADPESAFKELLDLYRAYGLDGDATARYQFAVYLARQYGAAREADIRAILAPLDADPGAHGVSFVAGLKNIERSDSPAKSNVVLLASLDPGFRTMLMSNGWTEKDFK